MSGLCLGIFLSSVLVAVTQAPPSEGGVLLAVHEEASLELQAFWDPCKESKYGLFERTKAIASIQPVHETNLYLASSFQAFLPEHRVEVGQVWKVKEEAVLPFLRQLHPGATAHLHHGSPGSTGARACLRAINATKAEVLIRAHAEFRIEDEIFFTPAQFEGRLVLDQETGMVDSFRLFLPSRNTNVDINVGSVDSSGPFPESRSYEADIGWVPRLEVTSGPSLPPHWVDSISLEKARSRLRAPFYAFAKIDWMPFESAVQESIDLGLPLHLIILFGCLDDESC